MKTRIYYFLFFVGILIIGACEKELGRGDVLADGEFRVAGLDSTLYIYPFSASQDTIRATIETAQGIMADTSNFDFTWSIIPFIKPDTLSRKTYITTSDIKGWFDRDIFASFGRKDVILSVTDKKTQVRTIKILPFVVTSPLAESWVLLGEKNSRAQLMGLTYKEGASGAPTYELLTDERQIFPEPPSIPGKPISLGITSAGIYVSTSEDLLAFDKVTGVRMQESETQKAKEAFAHSALPIYFTNFTLGGVGVYQNNDFRIIGSRYIERPANADASGNRLPIPNYYAHREVSSTASEFIFFDLSNRQFYYRKIIPSEHSVLPSITYIDVNYPFDTADYELLYFGDREVEGTMEITALFHNKQTKVSQLVCFIPSGVIRYVREIADVDLSQSTHFAVDPILGCLVYHLGSRLYAYDYNLSESYLLHDFGSDEIQSFSYPSRIAVGQFQPQQYREKYRHVISSLALTTYNHTQEDGGAFWLLKLPPGNQPVIVEHQFDDLPYIVDFGFSYSL